jgi:hypothetical protein
MKRTTTGVSTSHAHGLALGLAGCVVLASLLSPFAVRAQENPESFRTIPAILHAHSNWSSGTQTLNELVADSRGMGAEAVFLIENHLLRFEYGLWPLRGLIRYQKSFPSLLLESTAVEEYLRAVTEANARQNEVLLIPGVEVIPHYYWSGSLFDGTLTMFNGQKNLLVFGLSRPEDYRGIPAGGSYAAGRWTVKSLLLASPLLLIVGGCFLLRIRRTRVVRLQYFRVRERRRLVFPACVCIALGAALSINNYPFYDPPFSPYDEHAGLKPHQAVIDFVNARGGAAIWSMPEARDHQVVSIGSFTATMHTDPYPSDLALTDRFAGFGGIYDDTTTFTDPGSGWDQLLLAYLNGRRAAPAFAVGEGAYHNGGEAGKHFGDIQTVFFAARKDPQSLLQAFRAGRMYALRRTREDSLILAQFEASVPGAPPAISGGSLAVAAASRPQVRALITSRQGAPLMTEVRLIRSGQVVYSKKAQLPLAIAWTDDPLAPGAKQFYRLEAHAGGHRILSNPIFVYAGGKG